MPNWVNTVIEFDGSKENIDAVFKAIAGEGEQKTIDFNRLIPMPDSLNVESSSLTEIAYTYYYAKEFDCLPEGKSNAKNCREVIDRVESNPNIDPKKMLELGKQLHENKEQFGALTWYEWCIDNWGTKWNACYSGQTENSIEFSTAWSWPEPIMQKLAEVCHEHNVSFSGEWADEDCGNNTGSFSFDEKGNFSFGYYPNCSNEAFQAYERCFGEIDIEDTEQLEEQTQNNDIQMG